MDNRNTQHSQLLKTAVTDLLLGLLAISLAYLVRFEFSLEPAFELFRIRWLWNLLPLLAVTIVTLSSENQVMLSVKLSLSPWYVIDFFKRYGAVYLIFILFAFVTGGRYLPRSVVSLTAILHLISMLSYRWYEGLLSSYFQLTQKAVLILEDIENLQISLEALLVEGLLPVYIVSSSGHSPKLNIPGLRTLSFSKLADVLRASPDIKYIVVLKPSSELLEKLSELNPGIPVLRLNLGIGKLEPSERLTGIEFEDIIGRPEREIRFGKGEIERLAERRILLTGVGGSIGRAVLAELINLAGTKLRFTGVDMNEHAIAELKLSYPSLENRFRLGDLRDVVYLKALLEEFRPDVIIHTAAYKHLPILEVEIYQAILNDLLVVYQLLTETVRLNPDTDFIFISTDKAVEPTSVMGLVKRWAELVVLSRAKLDSGKRIVVRFGNVLGSSGSVLEVFRRALERGERLPITSTEAKRYFMSPREAGQLILYSVLYAQTGTVVTLDMGEPVSVLELAFRYAKLRGIKNPNIKLIGLREGEKLREKLWYPFERELKREDFDVILLDPNLELTWAEVEGFIKYLKANLRPESSHRILKYLKDHLPAGKLADT